MSTSTDSSHPADALKAQASEAVRKVSETLNDQANVLRDTTATARYNTQEFIENNPWQSVAIAASVGVLIGIIIARRWAVNLVVRATCCPDARARHRERTGSH